MKTYLLSELCNMIGESLQIGLPDSYLVTAEISGMQTRNGHCYMELVEKGKNNAIYEARIRAVCWASTYTMLSAYFIQETGQQLQNGMKVLVEVEINFHNTYGLSLVIVGIDPKYTLGDMQEQREKTIQQLKDDGVFDMNHIIRFPSLPKRIAVISSREAAGYEDFYKQLKNNSQGYAFKIDLFNAIMQGDKAKQSICSVLEEIASKEQDYDVVVITRGGGSTNDLSCFDDYQLCSYIAQFPLPVISAIGHTKDISIADMVANISLKTPTAAANYLIELFDRQADEIDRLEQRLRLELSNLHLKKTQELDNLQNRIINSFSLLLQKQYNNLDLIEHSIKLQSPQRLLKQGYSITLINGKPINSVNNVKSGDQIQTDVADGSIISIVK